MLNSPRCLWLVLGGMVAVGPAGSQTGSSGTGAAASPTYPTKPVRIVGSEPGGGGDFVSRLVAPGLTAALGQPIVIENRPTGVIQGEIVARAAPDGYTLLVNSGSMWIGQLLAANKVPYDALKDFAPITLAVATPSVLVVHPSLPVASVKDVVALAKARPGALNYSSGSTGSSTGYLAAELFKSMARVNIVHIPYKGSGPALNALVAGEVQVAFATAGTVAAHIKSGRLKSLAVTSAQPSALFPNLPTVASAGFPGYESATIYGMFAPANTPVAIINRLNQEIVRILLNNSDVKTRLLNASIEAVGSTPEELGAAVKSEMARLGKIIRDTGISGK